LKFFAKVTNEPGSVGAVNHTVVIAERRRQHLPPGYFIIPCFAGNVAYRGKSKYRNIRRIDDRAKAGSPEMP
jgi:hypothetical protein